jgi:hypothetical protein
VELLISHVQAPGRPPVRCTMAVSFVDRASVGVPRRHKLGVNFTSA